MFEDVDEVITADNKQRRRRCAFRTWAATLEPADAARAEELVHDRNYDCRSLARYFREKGATLNDQVLSRHRNLRCCGQAGT